MKSLDEQLKIIRTHNEFVVIDIETSHFAPEKGGMIIEIAAVKIRDGKIIDGRSQLIDPERKLQAKITEITGITDDMLVGKPKYREVLPKFHEFIGDAVIVAHNATFDWDRYLTFFFKKVGVIPTNEVVDTLSLSRKYLKNADKKYNLGYLCEMVNVELDNAHRALADTYATARLFLHLKDNYIGHDDQILFKIEDTPKISAKPQEIRNVSYWEKAISKKKTLQRIYVTLERSTVFLDVPTKSWEVKDTEEPIDFKELQKEICERAKVQNIDELIAQMQRKGA